MNDNRRRGDHVERQKLEKAIELYLDDCYRRRTSATASELAARLGAGRAYLHERASAALDETLRTTLRTRQLARAERLLVETPLTIAEIAVASGFGTDRTLFRTFKRIHGITPGQFRETGQIVGLRREKR
ncbi:MAG TPA: helix-turn-helix domain-containing protein [Thermoanaerobaculia bacterium]|nr:helix-turn-helix domain-containing protein [Thermoanaerobaculia bacterium]